MMDIFKGKTLRKADGSTHQADTALEGKGIVLIYFSAHWCPPCRAFTPVLKDFYEVHFLLSNLLMFLISIKFTHRRFKLTE